MARARVAKSTSGVCGGLGDEDLICDFGGVVAFSPHNCTDRWRTPERWYHVDMNVETYDGFESLQGFLALTDNNEESGGLVVVPGSHRHHADVSRRASTWWGVSRSGPPVFAARSRTIPYYKV